MNRRQPKVTYHYLRNGRVSIYIRGRKIHETSDLQGAAAFVAGYFGQ